MADRLASTTASQVEARPKANVQRRVYAAGEIATSEPEPARAQQPATPAAPRQPAAPADGGRPSSNSGSGNSSASRIDPAQIPRPEVLKTAERWPTRANVGQSPPAATSAFVVEDDGNCSPRYMRLTMNQARAARHARTR